MKVFHDTRAPEYRAPFGAVAAKTPVTLAIDVEDAADASVAVRTWTESAGEELHDMCAPKGGSTRFTATITPDAPGILWYHFVITKADGRVVRYGAQDGRTGGEGQLRDWEPPSFQLSVYDPEGDLAAADETFNNTGFADFADATTRYVRNETSAYAFAEAVLALRESYPAAAWPRVFELLETQDKELFFKTLSGYAGDLEAADIERDLDDGQRGVAKGRLWCASLIRALMPHGPMQAEGSDSGHDPYRPIAAAWDGVTADCSDIVGNAGDLKRTLGVFAGSYECFAVNDDVFGFWSRSDSGEAACTLVNSSLAHAYDVLVPMACESVSEVIGGYGLPVVAARDARELPRVPGDAERFASVHLNQLGSAIAFFHANERLARPMEPGLGVLAHITSIPGDGKGAPGTLGAPARAFVDWLAGAGVKYWQVLPVNPTDNHGSPYAGISAFAGNTRLIEGGPLEVADLKAPRAKRAYEQFCERERDWLEPYAAFMAIRDKLGARKPWQKWPKKYRTFDPAAIEADSDLRERAEQWRRAQFLFEQQWEQLKEYANERGMKIIGDMPIYVSADSSDVWAHPEIFQLDAKGAAGAIAGCPPDAFSVDGQIWGNPLYDWDALRANGYDWWLRRLARAFELYDVVRLDHFIGFSRYYAIEAGRPATEGRYFAGPGFDLFQTAREKLGPLPIIAEDLGHITPAVRALGAACGFPGMDIVQFVDGGDPLSWYAPRPEKVAFTGTHDNQTLEGYCEARYPGLDARDAADRLLEAVATCDADVRIMPLQDILGLDDSARMNTPGTAKGNWTWQADAADVKAASKRLRKLAHLK
ncbi:MAG: 4-alpha-glucanotransferase [Eggerthellaceae bacterium]|nr:4-alpha-glucanotransferase [Eggerthellaceae bacterium]